MSERFHPFDGRGNAEYSTIYNIIQYNRIEIMYLLYYVHAIYTKVVPFPLAFRTLLIYNHHHPNANFSVIR